MKYHIYINQEKCIEWGLSLQQGAILSLFTSLSAWAEGKEIDGKIYYYISVSKIIHEVPIITKDKGTILRHIRFLKDKGLLVHEIINNKGFYNLSELGKEYIFDKDIKLSSVLKMKHQVYQKGNTKCVKNETLSVSKMKHNNNTSNTNTNNNILSKDNIEKSEDFFDFNFSLEFKKIFLIYEKHRKEKKSNLTKTAKQQLLKKCLAVGEKNAIEKIKVSIENGWTGVFFDKEIKKEKLEYENKNKDFSFL